MIQRREHFRFALGSGETLRVTRQGRRQDFDGDLPFQHRVGGAVHLAHASFAQLGEDLVRSESGPNQHEVLANWATARSRRSSRAVSASGGGPPTPIGAVISYGPR